MVTVVVSISDIHTYNSLTNTIYLHKSGAPVLSIINTICWYVSCTPLMFTPPNALATITRRPVLILAIVERQG